jgi:hypothetical protein
MLASAVEGVKWGQAQAKAKVKVEVEIQAGKKSFHYGKRQARVSSFSTERAEAPHPM